MNVQLARAVQFESDDEAAAEEEAEALRLQRSHAATLRRADFGLGEADSSEDEDGDEAADTEGQAALGAAAAVRPCT